MHYREVREIDLPTIEAIYNKYHAKDFNYDLGESIISSVVVDEHDQVVALMMIRPIYEAIMILDTGRPVRDKVKALESLMTNGMFECARRGIKQVHAFISSASYVKLLKKQFGFKTAKGEAVVGDVFLR